MKANLQFAAMLACALGACGRASLGGPGGSSSDQGNTGNSDSATNLQSGITFALPSASFSGNSVRICGQRDLPADPKYRCISSLSSPDAGAEACPCFNFAADGSLIDPATGLPPVIDGLCPSVDFPNADWTFSYSIFSEQSCVGTQVNDGTHNLTCFDSRDLLSQSNPNASLEPLEPGPNENHVLCLTTNASKDFNFASCAINSTAADASAGLRRFDCGCTLADAGTCSCGANGVGPGDLPPTCSFDPTSCNIVCLPLSLESQGCQPAARMSVLINGPNVVSYAAKALWIGGARGIEIVNIEGNSVTPIRILTTDYVNSCASNSLTGVTVCASSPSNKIFVISGTTITSTLVSGATSFANTLEGQCSTCYAAMDLKHDRAMIGIATGTFQGSYQFLDLSTMTLSPPSSAKGLAKASPRHLFSIRFVT